MSKAITNDDLALFMQKMQLCNEKLAKDIREGQDDMKSSKK